MVTPDGVTFLPCKPRSVRASGQHCMRPAARCYFCWTRSAWAQAISKVIRRYAAGGALQPGDRSARLPQRFARLLPARVL